MARTIWLIWDGASHALVADLLQRGALPHLQQVVARGGLVATAPPGPNSETPPGLMSLFTGCEEPDHGTPGFHAPLPAETGQSVLESVSGFEPRWLRRPPVWVDAAAAGRSVALVSTAFAPEPQQRVAYPWPYPTAAYRFVMDGYNHEVARQQLVCLREVHTTVRLAEHKYEVRRSGRAYTVLAPDGASFPLEPFNVSQTLLPLWLDRPAGIGLYLACLTEPGKRDTDWLWCSAVHQLTSSPSSAWLTDLGPFLGSGIGWHFSRGVLGKGPRLPLASMAAVTCRVAAYFGALAVQALTHHPADFLVCYQPAIDEISHQMLREALTDWPYGEAARTMVQVYQEVDRQLGRCLPGLEADDTLLISSDHGHEPIQRSMRPNVLLRQAGLLQLNGDKVDLSRTRAVFHSSGWILLNSTERQGGIVPPEEYDSTLKDVLRCLDGAIDPSTGQPLGLQYSQSLWQGEAPRPGAVFVWAPDHVELRTHLFGTVCAPPEIGGNHQTVLHTSPYLKAILAGCGPGLAQKPWPTRNVEVAALVRRTLGLPASPTATPLG